MVEVGSDSSNDSHDRIENPANVRDMDIAVEEEISDL